MSQSLAERLAGLTEADRKHILGHLSKSQLAELEYDWRFWARSDQLPPEGDWSTWLILAGRGWGKTRTGAETVRHWVCGETPLAKGDYERIALVAETSADARDVMVEGESGILSVHPKDFRPNYEPSKRRLTWPNGAVAILYNAIEPDQLRGAQQSGAWLDELAKWRYVQETWDQLQFGMRLGNRPRQVITTTPRPLPLLKQMLNDPSVVVTKGHTDDNRANLAEPFLRQIVDRYSGTRMGRQELEAEILDDVPGALWQRRNLDEHRVTEAPDLQRIVVSIDPSTTSGEEADEAGVVASGIAKDKDGYNHGYVLDDWSLQAGPEEWARKAVALYRKHEADRIVAEKNQGGEMVETTIRTIDPNIPVTLVHASRGKYIRAEPISALYEQGRVHHVGIHPTLEDEMINFTPDFDRSAGSPNRVDSLVWGLTDLFSDMVRRPPSQDTDNPYARKKKVGWMGR